VCLVNTIFSPRLSLFTNTEVDGDGKTIPMMDANIPIPNQFFLMQYWTTGDYNAKILNKMMVNMQLASYEREKRLYHFDGYIANLYDKQDVCDSTILKWRSYLVQSIDLIIMKQRTNTKLISEFIDDELAQSKFFEFRRRDRENKINIIRDLIDNMYSKIFKVGITLAFEKSVQSLNISTSELPQKFRVKVPTIIL